MADDIKIKVGVQSSVKAGMDGVAIDIGASSSKIENAAGMHGKGFTKAFLKAFHGDFSGGVETIMSKMGTDGGFIGKGLVWGAGLATAVVTGFKAGGVIDEMFGISDKIAAAWTRAAHESGKAWDAFINQLRDVRLNAEGGERDRQANAEEGAKWFEIEEKRRLKRMTGREKAAYLQDNVDTLERTSSEKGISYEERTKRRVMLAQMKSDLEDALDEARKQEAEATKHDYDERVKEEKRVADEREKRSRESAEFEIDMAKRVADERERGLQGEIEARQKNEADAGQWRRGKIAKLDAVIAAGGGAGDLIRQGMDIGAFRDARAKERQDERDSARKQKLLETYLDQQERGTLSERGRRFLEGYRAERDARIAQKVKDALEKNAQEAAVRAAKSLEAMKGDIEQIRADLADNLRMGGN